MGKWTAPHVRGKVWAFREDGRPIRWIAKKLKIPISTIGDIAKQGDDDRVKPTGRPAVLSQREKRSIVKAVRRDGAATYPEIRDELGLKCSPRSVGSVANKAGYKSLLPPHKGHLTEANVTDRLAYCRKYKDKDPSFWRSGIHFYMDGTKFKKMKDLKAARKGLGKRKKRLKADGLRTSNIPFTTLVEATHTVPFFVGMSGAGKITLAEPYEPPLKMDAVKWGPIRAKVPDALRDAHPNLHPLRWVVSQDNDHAQNANPQWFSDKGINLHKGPPNSGDLRGIESAWPVLNRAIAKDDPGPESIAAFTARVRTTLLNFDGHLLLEPKLTNISNRLKKCIKNDGGRVNY